jgi:hypothetical protein
MMLDDADDVDQRCWMLLMLLIMMFDDGWWWLMLIDEHLRMIMCCAVFKCRMLTFLICWASSQRANGEHNKLDVSMMMIDDWLMMMLMMMLMLIMLIMMLMMLIMFDVWYGFDDGWWWCIRWGCFSIRCSCVVCSMQDALRAWSVGLPPSGDSGKQ